MFTTGDDEFTTDNLSLGKIQPLLICALFIFNLHGST